MIIHNEKKISDKQLIIETFAKNYKDICEGKDKEAKDYNKINSIHTNSNSTKSKQHQIKTKYNNILQGINAEDDECNVIQQNITTTEVIEMIKKLKLKTAPGEDLISLVALKYAGKELLLAITCLFQKMWSEGKVPDILQKSIIIPLYKKGEKTQAVNYRPIALLNSIFKVYEKILESRLRNFNNEHDIIKPCQKGTLKGSGTVEAIFALYSAIKQNNSKPITLAFLDLSKAYDRVWRTGLWTKIWEMGVRGRLFRAIHSTYSNATFQYMIGNSKSSIHQTKQGIRQGSVLSPLLFIMLYTDIVYTSSRIQGIPLKTKTVTENLTNQCFVDDTVLVAGDPAQIIAQIEGYNSQAAQWGTILNLHKTRIISNRNINPIAEWMKNSNILHEGSKSQLYLGVWISLHNDTWNTHYKNVIRKARKTLYYIKSKGLDRWSMPTDQTVNLLKKLVFTKITYAAEITTPSIPVINKVNKFLAEAIKSTTHIPWETSDEDVLWEAGMPDFTSLLQQAKFRFHHKLSSPKYSTNITQQYYTEGNYLYDHITPLITDAFGELTSKLYKDKIKKSKWCWKNEIQYPLSLNQINRVRNKLCFTMKPTTGHWSSISHIPEIHQRTFFQARLNAWGKKSINCVCSAANVTNPTHHIFFECTNEQIQFQRQTLWIMIDLFAPVDIKTSTKITQMLWLLGKPYNNNQQNSITPKFLQKTAELIYNAKALLSTQN